MSPSACKLQRLTVRSLARAAVLGVRESMRIAIFLLASILSGCAYLKNEAHVQNIFAAGWKDSEKILTYSCQNNIEISVLLNQPLATNGSTYFLFGMAPIGKAKFADQQLNLSVIFIPKEKVCKIEDIYLLVGNEKLLPSSVWSPLSENGMCLYLWSKELPKAGDLSINFEKFQGCEAPPIKVIYENKSSYNYDRLGG
ncbi:hypothetical protein [Gynuella sunshinyii]|nr:hypothetical protein [Gynuella sunshinyii]